MHPESIERLLNAVVEGDVLSLWQAFARETGTQDVDRFVIWLEARGEIDGNTAQTLLLAERLDLAGSATATFADDETTGSGRLPVEPGGHTVLSTLGAGAMGEVFLVRDEALRRKVALKKVTSRAANNPTLLARFLTEARVTAQLEHPSIIPVYGFERGEDGAPSYTMKLIQGTTFKEYLRVCRAFYEAGDKPDPDHGLDAALEHFLKVCDAMAFAHDRDILHRDLKPDNIMLGAFGEVVVMDWGIARVRGEDDEALATLTGLEGPSTAQLTRLGQAIGTPAFMSPEQALGENERLDGRSDLFSLGLILFEIVTLERAYTGHAPMAVLSKAQEGHLPPVAAKLAGLRVSRQLAAVVRKATRRRPADRYADVAAMADDIRRYLRGDAVSAVRESGLQRMGRWLSRHRQLTAFAVIALALLSVASVFGGMASVQLQRAEAQEHEFRLARLLGAVGAHAHRVDAQLLRYTALLESLGATARVRLQQPADEEQLFLNEAFAEGGEPPRDVFFSERYRQKVSFEEPVLKLAPGVEQAEVDGRLRQLAGARSAFRELFLRSHEDASARLARVQADALLRSDRVPVVWAYIAVEEGIHTSFPGHGP
ncbi:MAG: serine/threonine protein kinase, partial [Proteobacteria bacterium]|nr:serine/threonine protein kinase [Pseudomonadota bacterium]